MRLDILIERAAKRHCSKLTQDQEREVRGKLRFAEIDENNITPEQVPIVLDVIIKTASAQPVQERTAAVTNRCPRCGGAASPVKLAESTEAAYCPTCRVVIPGA